MIKYKQITEIPKEFIIKKIDEFLYEDAPTGDITSLGTIADNSESKANLIAKEDIVFCGKQIIEQIFNSDFKLNFCVEDGNKIKSGNVICTIFGNTKEILLKERIMLNLIQRMSGISTLVRIYTDIANPFGVKVLDTRKTTPGLRLFEKYAVNVGGGQNHRFDLSSGILIKDNHIHSAGGVKQAVNMAKKLKSDLPIQLEVTELSELKEVIGLGADGFLLDNMTPKQCKECVDFVRSQKDGNDYFLEASGGITLDNLSGYVKTGINAVSVGALTHSVKSSDISLNFVK